jgi:ABC-type antimicrobial peptide transport system permease subunit
VLYAAAVIVAIGLVASLYPVAIALRIQPVRAIQTE